MGFPLGKTAPHLSVIIQRNEWAFVSGKFLVIIRMEKKEMRVEEARVLTGGRHPLVLILTKATTVLLKLG